MPGATVTITGPFPRPAEIFRSQVIQTLRLLDKGGISETEFAEAVRRFAESAAKHS